jgi:hypothetical protein
MARDDPTDYGVIGSGAVVFCVLRHRRGSRDQHGALTCAHVRAGHFPTAWRSTSACPLWTSSASRGGNSDLPPRRSQVSPRCVGLSAWKVDDARTRKAVFKTATVASDRRHHSYIRSAQTRTISQFADLAAVVDPLAAVHAVTPELAIRVAILRYGIMPARHGSVTNQPK